MCVGWWVGAGVRGACGVSLGDRVSSYCDGGGEGQGVQELQVAAAIAVLMISLGWVKVCGVEHHVSHLDRDGIRSAGLDQVTLDCSFWFRSDHITLQRGQAAATGWDT